MVAPEVDLALDRAIAAQMPRSWAAFFGRYGRLRPIQRETIPAILDGRNVLVVAPTAGGKTEAAAAPVAERLLRQGGPHRALYIVPTRALANDLYQRLLPSMNACGLSLGVRTGEHRGQVNERVVLTTPESLDSVLCRGGSSEGHVLEDVGAIVLDEIHLLASSGRGEQMRWLLTRLDRIRAEATRLGRLGGPALQRIALSATIVDPRSVANAFLGESSLIRSVSGARQIDIAAGSLSGSTEAILPKYLISTNEDKKILVFCNTRRRVDKLTLALRGSLGDQLFEVHAHHGSLAQGPREEAEAAFRQLSHVVVVASSTLEIGIDVGDVDLVVLDAPPPDIASLLQRIGRGNRRRGTTKVLACAAGAGATLMQSALLAAARDGALGQANKRPRLAVMRQQVLSYIFQSPFQRRRPLAIAQLAEQSSLATTLEIQTLLGGMIAAGDLADDQNFLRLGPNWADRHSSLHSVIEDAGGMQVIDDRTGASLVTGIRYSGGDGLTTGGRELAVKGTDGNRIRTRPGDGTTTEGDWSYLARRMVVGPSQGFALRRHLGIKNNDWPILSDGADSIIFHLGGAARAILCELALCTLGVSCVSSDGFTIRLRAMDVVQLCKALTTVSEHEMIGMLTLQLSSIEQRLGLPMANRTMPSALRISEAAAALGLPTTLNDLREAKLEPINSVSERLRDIL
jgi:ATP-dependent helicase Lhr and Lhr-like helicase